jgi:hypothetical protein
LPELTIGGAPVSTVFDLLGRKENDITYALGWGLAQSPALFGRFLGLIGAEPEDSSEATLELQRYGKNDDRVGITDIEIRSPTLHAIVEAKRGWNLPLEEQLRLYRPRLEAARAAGKRVRFVVLTQWGETVYVEKLLGSDLDGIPISTIGLGQLADLANAVATSERQLRSRHLVLDLAAYLTGVAHMQDVHDNRVYVVSLSRNTSEAGISYVEVVNTLGVYWYPAGGRGGWPKTPFNYMGFRYDGKLQSVHHVRRSRVVGDLSEAVDQCEYPSFGPAFVLDLDESIPIPTGVSTGSKSMRSAHRVIDIDLLLTSPTISAAYEATRARHADG